MDMIIDRCRSCVVRENAICGGLTDPELRPLSAIGRRRSIAPGQVLSWAGDANLACANLVSGILKVTSATADGRQWCHAGGNTGLAISGSGDVLAGLIAGLAARGAPLEQAAAWGVALHAMAGEQLALRHGPLGYLAREISAEVPALLRAL